MTQESFKIDIRPDVAALRIFRSMSFTHYYALGEFVDNSITSALKNLDSLRKLNGPDYELTVRIDFQKDENSLTVIDNAAGISRNEIERALRTGIPPADTSVGLSRHGVGMKAAGLWWGNTIIVETYPLGDTNGWRAVIDISEDGDLDNYISVDPIPMRSFPGTKITVTGLWQKTPQSKTVTTIRSYLPSIYRNYLKTDGTAEGLRCKIYYEDKPLEFQPPKLLTAPYWPDKSGPLKNAPEIEWKENVDIGLSTGAHIKGWVGILAKTSRDYSGFFLHYRGKGISGVVPLNVDKTQDMREAKDAISRSAYKPRKIFGTPGQYPDISYIGEFDITAFGKTISTDSPLWSPSDEQEFIDKLYEIMDSPEKNFLAMAKNYRRKKDKDRYDEIEDKISDEEQAARIQEGLDGRIDHSTPDNDDLSQTSYDPSSDSESGEEALSISLHDKEGHVHNFNVRIIKDRSQDFLTIDEDEDLRTHEIRINQFHPSLDDIYPNTEVRKTLQILGLGMAASEVFLTDGRKSLVRKKMNELLSMFDLKKQNDN
jgi:hypothetical protein